MTSQPEHAGDRENVLEPERIQNLERTLRETGEVILEMRKGNLEAHQKSHNRTDFFTEADLTAERRVCSALHALFPDDAIDAEEGTKIEGTSGYRWVIDSIDGSKPCKEGGSFGHSVGREFRGQPVFGMVYYPVERKMLQATRGQATLLNGQPLRVPQDIVSLSGATVGFDHSAAGNHEEERVRYRDHLTARECSTQQYWCATKAVLDVLEGKTAAYVCAGATPYDLAAAVVIADGAECAWATLDHEPLDLSKPRTPIVFARNRELLQEITALYGA